VACVIPVEAWRNWQVAFSPTFESELWKWDSELERRLGTVQAANVGGVGPGFAEDLLSGKAELVKGFRGSGSAGSARSGSSGNQGDDGASSTRPLLTGKSHGIMSSSPPIPNPLHTASNGNGAGIHVTPPSTLALPPPPPPPSGGGGTAKGVPDRFARSVPVGSDVATATSSSATGGREVEMTGFAAPSSTAGAMVRDPATAALIASYPSWSPHPRTAAKQHAHAHAHGASPPSSPFHAPVARDGSAGDSDGESGPGGKGGYGSGSGPATDRKRSSQPTHTALVA